MVRLHVKTGVMVAPLYRLSKSPLEARVLMSDDADTFLESRDMAVDWEAWLRNVRQAVPAGLLLHILDGEPLHVVVAFDEQNGICHVVTAYRPSSDKFETDWKTRKS